MEHGLKYIAFYVQKHITSCTVVITSRLVRDKPLEAPASVKRVYCNRSTPRTGSMLWPNENPSENRLIHVKLLPFFKISQTYAWKNNPFSWFREFAPPIEKMPVFALMGTSMDVRFGRDWWDQVHERLRTLLCIVCGGFHIKTFWENQRVQTM